MSADVEQPREARGWLARGRALVRRGTDPGRVARSVQVIARSGAFDQEWYEIQRRRAFEGPLAAVSDYVLRGRRLGLSPHPLFEPSAWDPDRWRERVGDPFSWYLSSPLRRGRRPHPVWDAAAYLDEHPGARSHQGGAIGHLAEHADDGTELVLAFDGLEPARVPWGVLRPHLLESAESWAASDLLTRPRRTRDWDRRAERDLLRATPRRRRGTGGEPVVSVVMPTWNRGPVLRTAVRSLQAQTCTDWELLVVDDGSTDDTVHVARGLAAFDPRIRVLPGRHRGVSAARNTAIREARAPWVAFLDSDNTWEPRFLELSLAGLERTGARASYAAMSWTTGSTTWYRAFDGGLDELRVGNHVDLNVLVAETDLVRSVGGFAEDLRRTVDYDLVLKIAERTELRYLPFIGAHYVDDVEDAERISVREPLTWDFEVRARHLVDWDALRSRWQGADAPVDGVSAVVPGVRTLEATAETVGGLLVDGVVDEVVVVDGGSDRATALSLALLPLAEPRVRVLRAHTDVGTALGTDLALPLLGGATTVLCAEGVRPDPGCVRDLVGLLADAPDHRVVQPLVVGLDGAIDNAGVDLVGAAGAPLPLLRGHPVEDAADLGVVTVPAALGELLVVGTAPLVAVGGLEARLAGSPTWTDLSLRLVRDGGSVAVLTGARAHVVTPARTSRFAERDAEVFRELWGGVPRAADHTLWRRAGFQLAHVRGVRDPASPALLLTPVLSRAHRTVRDGPGAGMPALRWAIKTAAPAGRRGQEWGDRHFGEALARSLRRLGQDVAVHAREAANGPTGYLDDVELVIRGLDVVVPDAARISLLWVISHPDDVGIAELEGFDGVFAASTSWSATMTEQSGRPVLPLLQCTDPARFHPDVADPVGDPRVLFVGNSRRVYRPVVRHVVEAGLPLSVIGAGWEGLLPREVVARTFLPNHEVAAAYRRAGVVLNDHWEDMRTEGFVSNRLFDIAAAGGRALTDPVEGVEALFGGSVRTWSDPVSLVQMLEAPVEDLFDDDEQRRATAARVAREHSFDRRAEQLLQVAAELWERR